MAWRETCPMNERLSFVREVDRGDRSVAELCRVFGVSRKTGHKWIDRYRKGGEQALGDASRAPRLHPNAVEADVARLIIWARRRHRTWGPEKLLQWLQPRYCGISWPAISTTAEILRRAGLVKQRPEHWRKVPFGTPLVHVDSPNCLWSADYKGSFRTGNGRWCNPFTLSDNYSRYLLQCRALDGYSFEHVRPWFERTFREWGLPRAIRTDNGPPFGSYGLGRLTRLNVWWLRLGIIPEHIDPGKPQQNPRHERMHRTLKDSACQPRTDAARQQAAFERFRREYNDERPHQALNGATPASRFHRSGRTFPERLPEFQYPPGVHPRIVYGVGQMKWLGQRAFYVGEALIGEQVGLKEIGDGLWLVLAGPLAIGRLDARKPNIIPITPYIEIPGVLESVTHVPGIL